MKSTWSSINHTEQSKTCCTVWLASSRARNTAQFCVKTYRNQIILLGVGDISDVGPGIRRDSKCQLRFMMPIRFQVPFEDTPHVIALPCLTSTASDGLLIEQGVQSITHEGFSFVFRPEPDSARCNIGFQWLAIGKLHLCADINCSGANSSEITSEPLDRHEIISEPATLSEVNFHQCISLPQSDIDPIFFQNPNLSLKHLRKGARQKLCGNIGF